ncbi:hypothetical protein [Streptomyces sp. AM6-12]|uniref:hypothetical protein n=1 Tax=Streptomyces sp. AM6-12 TaxID=3345149 RepID=UPI00379BA21E
MTLQRNPTESEMEGEPDEIEEFTIFDDLPYAGKNTFDKSVSIMSSTNERRAVVFYAPDLKSLCCIDNSASEAEATYTKSVTEGFTHSESLTVSAQYTIEGSFEIAKASKTFGFSFTFSAETSKSTTESISFTVPAGKKAFLYQGFFRTKILKHSPAIGEYSWVEGSEGLYLCSGTKTTTKPLIGPATLV